MSKNQSLFFSLKKIVLLFLLFLFPFFFLPFTEEFFYTSKLYFIASGALVLILLSTAELLTTKKIRWQKGRFDNLLILFFTALIFSVAINSPNKIQALFNPNFGPVIILFFIIFYFYLSRSKIIKNQGIKIAMISALILSIITIIFFFNPLKNINLPQYLLFLKTPGFTPVGTLLDLALFLGFFVILKIGHILKQSANESIKKSVGDFLFFIVYLVALSLTLYTIFQPTSPIQLPPFHLSWYAAVETLKNPLTALFGVGIDNFAVIFTRVKDIAYNQSLLWQVNSFNLSRSTFLHVFTETGLFGLLMLGLILFYLIKQLTMKQKQFNNLTIKIAVAYLLFVILFFPPSPIVWFLFILILALTNQSTIARQQLNNETILNPAGQIKQYNLSDFPPVYLGLSIISLIFVFASVYFLGRAYLAEWYFKQSLESYTTNNALLVYNNQRQAIILNPFIERFRTNFSQTNLIIANNVASKTQKQTVDPSNKNQKPYELTEQDRQTIAQAVQASIAEAKAAVALNSQKAKNWENLAVIYRNIINVVQEADAWTISAYQRAIIADPQNFRYRLNLGGVYYTTGRWDEANRLFQEAVVLKPDWANAYYNLAWSYAQKNDYKQAVNAMESALTLIDKNADKEDYERTQTELEEFKKKLPKEETETETTDEQQQTNLNLPSSSTPQIEPKIQLPKETSPETR